MSAQAWLAIVNRVIRYLIVDCTKFRHLESSTNEQEHRIDSTGARSLAVRRGHKLLTEEIRRSLPQLYANEHVEDPIVQVKFFSPWSNWTWYATEFDGVDLFFGLVEGFESEWGYFSLSELDSTEGPFGMPAVERDLWFQPTPVSQLEQRTSSKK